MAKYNYKVIRRDHAAGQYESPDELFAAASAADWELITVNIAKQILNDGFTEIFYFRKSKNVEEAK